MRDKELENILLVFIFIAFAMGFFFGGMVRSSGVSSIPEAVQAAYGPCDSVRDCGEYQCRVGIEGWNRGKK